MTPTEAPKKQGMFFRSPVQMSRKKVFQSTTNSSLPTIDIATSTQGQGPQSSPQNQTQVDLRSGFPDALLQSPVQQSNKIQTTSNSTELQSPKEEKPSLLLADKSESKRRPSFASTSRRFSDMTKGSVDMFWQQMKRLNSTESVFFGMPPIRRHLSKESSSGRRRRRRSGARGDLEDDEQRRLHQQELDEQEIRDAYRVNMVLEQIKSDKKLSAAVDAFGSRSIYQQSLWYAITFYITYIFATVNRVIQYKTGQNVYLLVALHVFFVPLQVRNFEPAALFVLIFVIYTDSGLVIFL